MEPTVDVIEFRGDNSTFVWKSPIENFNYMTQLIVREGQEAIFMMNGQALDLFGPGRHTLETPNIPLLSKFLGRTTGDKNPFTCDVYFITKTVTMDVKWGTDSKVRYVDPALDNIPIALGASGSMNLQVNNGRKLLEKLVGTTNGIAWEDKGPGFAKSLQNSFRPMISTAVKSNLTASIKERNIDIFEIDESLSDLSADLAKKITPGFEEYGLTVANFYITTVVLPEEDPNFRQLRENRSIGLKKHTAHLAAEYEAEKSKAAAEAAIAGVKAKADVESAKAAAEAAVRAAELERQTTETEIAKRAAEREVIAAQAKAAAEAELIRAKGLAEAQVMQAKGYTEKDVLQADVQKAWGEGIGKASGGGGSVMGDVMGIGIGLQAANAMNGQFGNIFPAFGAMAQTGAAQNAPANLTCAKCGASIPSGSKFCLECGTKVEAAPPEDKVVCPGCGQLVAKGKFCLECGYKFITKCPKCGNEVPAGAKFCLECGEKL